MVLFGVGIISERMKPMRKYVVAPELRRIGAKQQEAAPTERRLGATLRQPFFWLGAEAEKPPEIKDLGDPRFDRDVWQALADPLGEALAKAGAIDVVM
jgi:hypothetical protein